MSTPEPDQTEALSRVPKMSEVLADRLRARILGAGLQPGDPLASEPELIAGYGVARATVREALRLLESDGIIEIRRGRGGGILVRQPDLKQSSRSTGLLLAMRGTTLRELFDFRLLVEPEAARAAAERATVAERRHLSELAAGKWQPDLSPAVEFHNAIGRLCHNDLLMVSIATLAQEFRWHAPDEALSPPETAGTDRAHRAIARAIRDGDGVRAHAAMTKHIESFRKFLDRRDRLDQPIVPRSRWLSRS
jgi:GntR family transcriptional repressor for pyruvate dehydrogenase complex